MAVQPPHLLLGAPALAHVALGAVLGRRLLIARAHASAHVDEREREIGRLAVAIGDRRERQLGPERRAALGVAQQRDPAVLAGDHRRADLLRGVRVGGRSLQQRAVLAAHLVGGVAGEPLERAVRVDERAIRTARVRQADREAERVEDAPALRR